MSTFYRNIEGYPKRTLRENIGDKLHATNAYVYSNEIADIMRVDNNIKEFYKTCLLSNKINTKNNIFANEILENIDNKFLLIDKERQIGFSTTLAIIALYYTQVLDKSVVIIDKDGSLLKRIKQLYVYVPEHLKWGVKRLNKKEIKFNNGSYIKKSNNIRGNSPDLIIYDEYDFLSVSQMSNMIIHTSVRVGDRMIIGSTINPKRKGKYSMKDLIDNKTVYGFKQINLTDIVNLRKQLNRNNIINDILGC